MHGKFGTLTTLLTWFFGSFLKKGVAVNKLTVKILTFVNSVAGILFGLLNYVHMPSLVH